MKNFIKSRNGLELIVETVISVIFGAVILSLGWLGVLTGRELVYALIVWALITPSPSHWAIVVGDFLRAQKDGCQNGNGGSTPPTGGNPTPDPEPDNSNQG